MSDHGVREVIARPAARSNNYSDWGRFREPARPSADVIGIYDRALSGAPRRVLLLGSTPEIRTLCHRHDHDLTIVDVARDIYENVSYLVEEPGEETFVCGNWLEMDFEKRFAVAIGDGSINMLDHAQHRPLFESVWRQLESDGELVLHTHFVSEKEFDTPDEVFRWWRASGGEGLFENTWYHLTHFYDIGEGGRFTFDYGAFDADLERLLDEGQISQSERETFGTALSNHTIKVYFCDWETLRRDVAGLFEIVSSECPADYPGASAHPVIRFRKTPA